MKSKIIPIFIIILMVSACGGSKKSMKKSAPAPVAIEETDIKPEPPKPEPVIIPEPEPKIEAPIKEVSEKLVPVKETPPVPDQYFVIIGSFRNYDNALNYQKIINTDGFNSVLLKNDKGLYRVSVLGTNNISEARTEIRKIRTKFHKHNDTWLLIQLK